MKKITVKLNQKVEKEMSLDEIRKINNPKNEPTGNHTGRCRVCHSDDLWDDNLAYGCNCCGAFLSSNF